MRSKYKIPFIGKTLHNFLYKNADLKSIVYYTKNKSIQLIPFLLNLDFTVYNGFGFYNLKTRTNHTNRKLGELLFTRKFFKFKRRKRK